MKRLIVCCDGTWNTPEQEENNIPAPTNVVRLFNALADTDAENGGNEQRKYYHTGVGTEGGFLARTAGGAFGEGLDKNIQSAYAWLGWNYSAGDAIYQFGFSRGAYTVRSLGGLIGRCGLPDLAGLAGVDAWERIDTAYHKGYQLDRPHHNWRPPAWAWHEPGTVTIELVGVWDTVGALGVPDDLALLNLFDDPDRWRFYNTQLGERVRRARHAIAIDEMRASFAPTLWTDAAGNALNDGDRVKQLWFPGVHCDVGGGYAATGLSDVALKWMIDEAAAAGLLFRPGMVRQVVPDPRGPLHDSFKGVFKAMRSHPRGVPSMELSPGSFHPAALERQDSPPITQAPYHPSRRLAAPGDAYSTAVYAGEVWNETGLFLEAGVEYEFAAQGEWLDRNIPCGPGGTDDGKFKVGEIAHLAGALVGKLEGLFRKFTDNKQADFKFTRRVEEAPWFALIGVIANGDNPTPDGTVAPHEDLIIKEGPLRVRPKRPGYLYAFANDAWHFYENNRGSVTLTVRRIT